ncbi:conserved hypothetical protein [Vibrio aestuarianus]|nr:conserved hypothetical protein [Vibrio aestuarianus]CAH8184592.1 conserved hypothetical protein [Vibrio aestuarianus]CAH8193941.1 conserved hypothetical protein [Vibrio aestuarianus]CAH8196120.1 conserved hypothetical protein [Vibrio aestuarianus]
MSVQGWCADIGLIAPEIDKVETTVFIIWCALCRKELCDSSARHEDNICLSFFCFGELV